MNLLEVLQEVKKHPDGAIWFRPVGWKGDGVAFLIEDSHIYIVPSPMGGERYMLTYTEELLGEWELVDPRDVCEWR